MKTPVELFVTLYGLAFVSALVVGTRFVVQGVKARRGGKLVSSGRTGLIWQSLSFFPWYFTLPVLWIEWPLSPGSLGFALLFLYFFVPYVKSLRGDPYLVAFNVSAPEARAEVEKLLGEMHEDVILEGLEFKSGEKTLVRANFVVERKFVYLGFPPGPYRDREKSEAFRGVLEGLGNEKGDLSPGLFHGLIFLGVSVILAWVPVAALLDRPTP